MTYSLKVTEQAECDLTEAAEYIAFVLENPIAAESFIDAVESEFASLSEFPNRGSLVNDARLAMFGIRFVIVKNYYIFFQVDEAAAQVYFLRILHARREWSQLVVPQVW